MVIAAFNIIRWARIGNIARLPNDTPAEQTACFSIGMFVKYEIVLGTRRVGHETAANSMMPTAQCIP
jgi:hypothetical protein